ncbi:hypothetical protein Hanom_Chr03g00193591 [Helianthus anomalus]
MSMEGILRFCYCAFFSKLKLKNNQIFCAIFSLPLCLISLFLRAVIGGLGGLNLFWVIVLSAILKTIKIVEPSRYVLFVYKTQSYPQPDDFLFITKPMTYVKSTS